MPSEINLTLGGILEFHSFGLGKVPEQDREREKWQKRGISDCHPPTYLLGGNAQVFHAKLAEPAP
ncbi:MAG: hypothetical protein AAB425_06210, partial [Bdellovibrionota bacterium]